MREDQVAATTRLMIGAEEKTGQRIRVHVAFEAHASSPLDIQDHAVPVIVGWPDGLCAGFLGQLKKIPAVRLVEPRQAIAYLVSMYPAARNGYHLVRLAGQDGRARKVSEIGAIASFADIETPAFGKSIGYVKRSPAKTHRRGQVILKDPDGCIRIFNLASDDSVQWRCHPQRKAVPAQALTYAGTAD
jgi:hypothetical protein